MNAPATLAQVRPDHGAVRADDLVSLEMISKLVSFDTTSRDSNLALIEWVRNYFDGHGIASSLTFDDDQRTNLFRKQGRVVRRDLSTEAVTHDHRCRQGECLDDSIQVIDEWPDRIMIRVVAVAVAA